jgi:hypothetical protein
MERKTKINAEDGKQELMITREFDLPLELLFKAYEDAEIVEQWMGTKVLTLENKKHGSYWFETTDPKGNKYGFNGVIHDQTKRSQELLNLRIHLLVFSLRYWNLNNLLMTQAS